MKIKLFCSSRQSMNHHCSYSNILSYPMNAHNRIMQQVCTQACTVETHINCQTRQNNNRDGIRHISSDTPGSNGMSHATSR